MMALQLLRLSKWVLPSATVMEEIEKHAAKAFLPIDSTELPIDKDSINLQSKNASCPMETTVFGMTTDVR